MSGKRRTFRRPMGCIVAFLFSACILQNILNVDGFTPTSQSAIMSIRSALGRPQTMTTLRAVPQTFGLESGYFDQTHSLVMASEGATVTSFATLDPETATSGLSPTTTVLVFVIGLLPFAIATVEFWRRIAVGESFGTGSDSVVFDTTDDAVTTIGEDNDPASSRGRRILGKDALYTAYALFGIAAAVLGLVIYSVLTTPMPTPPPL